MVRRWLLIFLFLISSVRSWSYYFSSGIEAISVGLGVLGSKKSNSIFYNPASIADISNADVSLYYNPRFGLALSDNTVSIAYPVFAYNFSVGFGALLRSVSDVEDAFSYSAGQYNVTIAFKAANIDWGATIKFFNHKFEAYGNNYGSGFGIGYDVGLGYAWRNLRFAGALLNIGGLNVTYQDQTGALAQNMVALMGVAYKWKRRSEVVLGLNTKRQFSVSAIYKRANMRMVTDVTYNLTGGYIEPGVGLNIAHKYFALDFSAGYNPYLGFKNSVGVSYNFAYKKSPVTVEKLKMKDLIPAFYVTGETIGIVELKNNEKVPQSGKLIVTIDDKGVNYSIEFNLASGEKKVIGLTFPLTEDILFSSEDMIYTVKARAVVLKDDKEFVDDATANFLVYSRNAFKWDDVLRLSAFVFPHSKNVEKIARYIKEQYGIDGTKPLKFIVAGFDLLGAMGITYINDPVNPFAKLSEAAGVIDNIQLPFETIKRGAGDCDDDVVLLCSLFENQGLSTFFVDFPNHLMLLVGTGISEKSKLGRFKPFAVKIGNEYYIPIEATKIGMSIYAAVEDGYKTFKDKANTLYNVDEGLAKYRRKYESEPDLDIAFPATVDMMKEDLKYVE